MSASSTILPLLDSPFEISITHERDIMQYDEFVRLKEELRNSSKNRFCATHKGLHFVSKACFWLHRDYIHAAFGPLLEMMIWTESVASRVLPDTPVSEQECLFHAEGRDAFTWLHTILAEEVEWCLAEGCPICVVQHTFHSKDQIRLLSVACRMSVHLRRVKLGPMGKGLPSFDFFHIALENAVRKDWFWGPDTWREADGKAATMQRAIKEMIVQTLDHLDRLRKQLNNKAAEGSQGTTNTVNFVTDVQYYQRPGAIPVLLFKLAVRELAMEKERHERLSKLSAQQELIARPGNCHDEFRVSKRRKHSRVPTIVGPNTKPRD